MYGGGRQASRQTDGQAGRQAGRVWKSLRLARGHVTGYQSVAEWTMWVGLVHRSSREKGQRMGTIQAEKKERGWRRVWISLRPRITTGQAMKCRERASGARVGEGASERGSESASG